MDQELGLRGSLLPQKEENIPDLEPLLAPALKFKYVYRCIHANSPAKGKASKKLLKIQSFSLTNMHG